MEKSVFLSLDGDSLFSHVKVYENQSNQKIHLIPVSHIGKKEYFYELVEYVGNSPCLFEFLRINSEDLNDSIKNIDDYLELYGPICEDFWQKYKKMIRSFYKNFITRELNQFRKYVKKQVNRSNEKLRKIYEYCEKSKFSFPNLPMLQLYWCELLKLDHQFIVLDFKNDILHRPNWIHADLDIKELIENDDLSESAVQLLTDPSPAQLQEVEKEINIVLNSILELVHAYQVPSYTLRRMNFAGMLIDIMSKNNETHEKMNPDLLMKTRNLLIENKIIELLNENTKLMVFYGASHMINIEKFLFQEGFSAKSFKKFVVFNVNYD
jgi:hypothetical protein